jgi:hypothetical protein
MSRRKRAGNKEESKNITYDKYSNFNNFRAVSKKNTYGIFNNFRAISKKNSRLKLKPTTF